MKELIHIHRELEHLSKRLHRGSTALLLSAIVVVMAAGAMIGMFRWYGSSLESVSTDTATQVVDIEPGSSVNSIANLLENEGIIKSSTAFIWYVQSNGDRANLQAGLYSLSPSSDVEQIVDQLSSGNVANTTIRVSPGQRLDQLADQLSEYEAFDQIELQNALLSPQVHPLFDSNPNKSKLEGYLFPDTYTVDLAAGIDDFLAQVFDTFEARLTDDIKSRINAQGLSIHEAIILASIVQQEVSDPEEQRTVAQVFIKRLNEGITLGSDVTFVYAARVTGQTATPELDSPYNTRLYAGLPPGPIGNFNFSALEAVANPTNTDYLFFVAGDDQNTYFSNTVEEHQALVDQYCIELCSLEVLN